MRCERSTGCEAAASCTTEKEANRPSASTVYEGRSVLTPAVSSHSRDQAARSRPETSSSEESRSARVALPYECAWKYFRTPARKFSRPT